MAVENHSPPPGRKKEIVDLSVCIVNTSNIRYVKPCLESIYERTERISFEIIVVDNNSSDDSVEIIRREFSDVKLIEMETTGSFSPNMNKALRAAKGRYILSFNDDMLLTSNAFSEMVAFMDANPEYGALSPKLVYADGSLQMGPRGPATLWTIACSELKLQRLFPKMRLFSEFEMTYWDSDQPTEIETATGACILLRREVVNRVGLLEERIELGPEDVEFCYRIRSAGWKIYYLGNVSIIHYGGVSKLRIDDLVINQIRMYKGWFWFWGNRIGWLHANIFRLIAVAGALLRIPYWLLVYLTASSKRQRALAEVRGRFAVLRLSLNPSLKKRVNQEPKFTS